MFIRSNNYQLKDTNDNIFNTLHTNEFPVSHVIILNSTVVFSSRNEVFLIKDDKSIKKLAGMDSDVSTLTVSGEFIGIGSLSGSIKIFSGIQNCIRSYSEHTAAVNDIKVIELENKGGFVVISCSDDSTARIYRLTEERSFFTVQNEDRYINSVDFINNFIVTASDKLEVYRVEDKECVFTRSFEQKISHVVAVDPARCVVAVGNSIGIINIQTGDVQTRIAHTRPIEHILVYKNVIYSVSCDGHFKSFSMNLKLINDFNLREKISGFGIENDRAVVSLVSGSILGTESKTREDAKKPVIKTKQAAYEDEIVYEVLESGKKRLTEVEALLRKFEYKACFKLAMAQTDPTVAYSVLLHIRRENALKKVLSDENSDFLEDFLLFCIENIKIQECKHLIIECLTIITSIYFEMILEHESIKELLVTISSMIYEEIQFQEICLKAIAFLDGFKLKGQ